MGARAIWKGIIRCGQVSIPVKLYAAVEDKTLHFRLLHAKDQVPVRQELVHPDSNAIVPRDQVRHGFATEDGRLAILSDADLATLTPDSSRDIVLSGFLPAAAIDHRWYERPYFLGPDGDPASYSALSAALEGQEIEGLARWVMRRQEYIGVLRLHGQYPVLITLRHAEEIVAASELSPPAGRRIAAGEMAMAEQLIGMMAARFDLAQYQNEYRQRLLALIERKSRGKVIKLQKAVRKKTSSDLQAALAASLQAIRERQSA